MNWFEKMARSLTKLAVDEQQALSGPADDLRPPYAGSLWTCPNCSSYNSQGQILPQCPGCNRDTTGIQSYLCPDCKTRISTGKKGDCSNCGFDWSPQPMTLENPISSLGSSVKHGHLPQLAYDVGAKTINDIIRVDYETIKANLFEWWDRGQSGFGANRWEGKTEEEISEIRHTQVMGRLHNLIFEIFNYTKYPYVQLPPEYISWATYLNDSFEKDGQVIEHKDTQNRKLEEYENKRRLEGEASEQKARMLADELYRRKDKIWSDMDEETTPEDALEIARDFIKASPHQRGQWRGPIRDIANKLFSREFPEKQYFMEPEEAYKFVEETQRKLDQWYANKWELVKDDELLDIISKTIGITNSKSPQDLDWDTEGVHPGYTATYVLAPAANMRYYGMQELARRLQDKKDDRAYINQMYSNIDEDIRPLFFRSKLGSCKNWLQKVSATLQAEDMLEHAVKAITMTLPGSWEIVENRPNLAKTDRFQRYGVMTLHGKDVYQPEDEFLVKVFGFVRRTPNNMPDDLVYQPEQAQTWMDQNSVSVNEFDSNSGHSLVYYHCVVAGNIPGRNWEGKHQVGFWSTDNPMYEIGNTRSDDDFDNPNPHETPLYTPFDLAEWVQNTIKRGYQDFGNDGDGDDEPDSPMFPEWPYGEEEYTQDSEDLDRIVAPRVRGYA